MKSSRTIILTTIFLFSRIFGIYAVHNFTEIDKIALSTPYQQFSNIDDVVNYGRKTTTNEADALRFYFVWVARNISYDNVEIQASKRNPNKQEPENVFRSKKAICRGYSDLLTVICKKAGIHCRSVAGYTNTQNSRDDLHAWNAIEINNEWALYDVTWASNYLETHEGLDEHFETYYKQSNSNFLKKHFPFDPIWQLSEFVLPKSAFLAGDTEGVFHSKIQFGDYKKILTEENNLDWAEQGIRSFERALSFIPEESRLYEALNYYKSEKAGFYFKQSRSLLEQFKHIQDDDVKKWTIKDIDNLIREIQQSKSFLIKAKAIMLSMTSAEIAHDLKAQKENLVIIDQNLLVSIKILAFLEETKHTKN